MDSLTSSNLDSESLFSLELVVDKLFLPKNVVCRFPAIAFRLLDFPTLMIYHVEPQVGENIKAKIAADPHYKPAAQLHELHDKDGCFPVKKGKSSLFRVAANNLLRHLTNTPLYVMVIDTYPETPKLLGNSTIGLDCTMEAVYDDICRLGLSVPSVHGDKGVYKIYNLMGIETGQVALGFRLLSLGVALLSHIPDRALVKLAKRGDQATGQPVQEQNDDVILEDLEAVDKNVQVEISSSEKQMHGETQTDMASMLRNVSVQTHKKQRKKDFSSKIALNTHVSGKLDDFFVTNAVCPPPLFYNSEADPKTKVFGILKQAQVGDADSGSDESLSTIRPEDNFSDSDNEFLDEDLQPKTVLQEEHSFPKRQDEIVASWMNKTPKKQQVVTPLPFANFPVLNALLQEIATIPGCGLQSVEQPLAATLKASKSPRTKTPRSARFTPRPVEAKDANVVERLSSPRHQQAELAPSKLLSKGTTGIETQQKGWLRKHGPATRKATKLTYGMTNTQRLRLAKGNPEVLKTLEKTEQERLEKRRAEQLKKYPWLREVSGPMKLGTADLSTEISKHPGEGIPKLDLHKIEDGTGAITEMKPHKKPVPTPRLSLSLTDKDKPLLTPRLGPSKSGTQATGLRYQSCSDTKAASDQDNSVSYSSRSHKSIEVHVPSAGIDDQAESEATSVSDFELDKEELEDIMGKTRTIHAPGFLQDTVDTNGVHQYSEDFEDENQMSHLGEEPFLKKVVDKYSDSDSGPSMTGPGVEGDVGLAATGEDLGLKRVVETYSDYSEPGPSQGSDQRSYLSANSEWSAHSPESGTEPVDDNSNNLHLKPGVAANPPSSIHSPITAESLHTRQPDMATREPFVGSSPTTDNHPGESALHDAMAQLSKTALTIDSSASRETEEQVVASPRKPKASPRHSIERTGSVHTESVSSFVPSEGDNLSPMSPGEEYSDSFEDDNSSAFPEPGHVSEIKLAPEAKLGYTWA